MSHGRLVWSDAFDGPAGAPPDPRVWRHETGGGGWGNGELQTYTEARENAALDGQGCLAIRALRGADGAITSARLIGKGLVECGYGRIEARIRVPAGAGLWAAFWLLGTDIDRKGWPGCGEIDVMEVLGRDPARVFGTVHCPGHSGAGGIGGGVRADGPLSDSFHLYSVDWTPERIGWSLDGAEYFSVTQAQLGRAWVFDHPVYPLLNLAVGGTLGGAVGADTLFPATMLVDHVRHFAGDAA